jgi:hypothetical protein
MSLFASLVEALLITILLEAAVFLILLKQDISKLLLCSILINSFTNPLLNYFYNFIMHDLLMLELAVVGIESLLLMALMQLKFTRALAVSSIANLVSGMAGLLLLAKN